MHWCWRRGPEPTPPPTCRYDTTLGPEVTNAFYLPFGPATSSSAAVPGGQATGTLTTGSPGSAQAAAAQGQAAKVAGGVSSTSDKGAAAATAKPLPAAAALSAQDQALGAAALTSLAALDTPAMRSSETAAASYRAILAAQALARLAGGCVVGKVRGQEAGHPCVMPVYTHRAPEDCMTCSTRQLALPALPCSLPTSTITSCAVLAQPHTSICLPGHHPHVWYDCRPPTRTPPDA
jgi:hypothetical protein